MCALVVAAAQDRRTIKSDDFINQSVIPSFVSLSYLIKKNLNYLTAVETAATSKKMKVCEALRLIQDDGWFQVRCKGSHRQFHHTLKKGTVTISGHPGIDIPKGTLNSILKQAGLKQ